MTKAELIKNVASRTGIDQRDVSHSLEGAFDEIIKANKRGDAVAIRGFGTFQIKVRKQKMGRNISKGTAIVVPEHSIPYFKPHFEL